VNDDRAEPRDQPAGRAKLVWSSRRAAEAPLLCALLVIFEFVLAVAVNMYYGPSYAALAVGFVTLALIPFYASYTYVLEPEVLQVHGPFYYVEYRWTEFESWRLSEGELRLVFKQPHRPSVLVLYAPHDMDQALQFVQRYLPSDKLEDRRL